MKTIIKKFTLKDVNGNVVLKKTVSVNTETDNRTIVETKIAYNRNGQKDETVTFKNGEGHNICKFKYDENGNLSEKITATKHNTVHKKFKHCENGDMIETDMVTGSTITWVFDHNKKVIKVIHKDGSVTEFIRDAKGNLLQHLKDGVSLYHFEYDDNGRVVKRIDSKSNTLSYEYDDEGRITKVSDSVAGDIEHKYVAPGLCVITDHIDDSITYEIDLSTDPVMDI